MSLGGQAHAAAGDAVIVDEAEFRCMAQKVKQVPSEPRGVFVDISRCRNGGPRIVRHLVPPPPSSSRTGVESLLFLKPKHLKCIAQFRRDLAKITEPAGPGKLKLRIDPCAK